MILRILASLVLFECAVGTGVADGGPKFIEKEDLGSGPSRIYAVLTVDNPILKVGDDLACAISFHNGEGSKYQKFYDLDFNPLRAPPGIVALYDANKKFVCDLLEVRFDDGSGSMAGIVGGDIVPPSGHVTTKLFLKAGLSALDVTLHHHQLSPGDYYLQVIYLKALVEVPESGGNGYDESEFFRSNLVKITLTK